MTALSTRLLGWLAIASIAYHSLAMVSLHVLMPEVSIVSGMVGEYLAGPYQTLSRTTFLAIACALATTAVGLNPSLPAGAWSGVAKALIVLSILGFLGVTGFPAAAPQIGMVTRPATVLALIALSFLLRKERGWARVAGALMTVSILFVVLFLATFSFLVHVGLGGLANRAALLLIYAWVVLVACELVRTPRA